MSFLRAGRAAVRFSHNLPFARVSNKDRSSVTPLLATSHNNASLNRLSSSVIYTIIRAFTDKPVSRPKQHTGRAPARKSKSSTTTKTTTFSSSSSSSSSGTKKKTTAKKPKTKAKAKPKPKKKAVKKKKQPSKTATLAAKSARIAELKKTSLKGEEPAHGGLTSWIVYLTQDSPMATAGGSVASRVELIRAAAVEFRSLAAGEREALNHRANTANAAARERHAAWLAGKSPAEVHAANAARRQLRRLKVRGFVRARPIADERQVKRTRNARSWFTKDRWASGDFKNIALAEASRLISQEWKDLPAGEKQRYTTMQEEDHRRYINDYKQVFGKDPPGSGKK